MLALLTGRRRQKLRGTSVSILAGVSLETLHVQYSPNPRGEGSCVWNLTSLSALALQSSQEATYTPGVNIFSVRKVNNVRTSM